MQSSLVLRFVNNDFQENKEPTIGGPLSLVELRFRLSMPSLTFDSRLPDAEMQPTHADHQVRDLGYGRPGTVRLSGSDVLP